MKLYKSYIDKNGKTRWIKKNFKELIESLHPCPVCSQHHLRIDNTYGWTNAAIWCQNCKHHIEGKNLSETMDRWNAEFEKVESKFEQAKDERKEMLATIKELNKVESNEEYNPRKGMGVRIKIDDEIFNTLKEAAAFLEIDCSYLNKTLKAKNPAVVRGFTVERLSEFHKRNRKSNNFRIINENTKEVFKSYKECASKYHIKAKDLKRNIELFNKYIMRTGEILRVTTEENTLNIDTNKKQVINSSTAVENSIVIDTPSVNNEIQNIIKEEIKENIETQKYEIKNAVKAGIYDALKVCAENEDLVMLNKLLKIIAE